MSRSLCVLQSHEVHNCAAHGLSTRGLCNGLMLSLTCALLAQEATAPQLIFMAGAFKHLLSDTQLNQNLAPHTNSAVQSPRANDSLYRCVKSLDEEALGALPPAQRHSDDCLCHQHCWQPCWGSSAAAGMWHLPGYHPQPLLGDSR